MESMWYAAVNFYDETSMVIYADEDEVRAFVRSWKATKEPNFEDKETVLEITGMDDDDRKPHPQEVFMIASDIKFIVIGRK